jgi:exopolysaccharide production protein ExoY
VGILGTRAAVGKLALVTLITIALARAPRSNHPSPRQLAVDQAGPPLGYDFTTGFDALPLARDCSNHPLGGRKKRIVDMTLAVVALTLAAPIMLLVATLIRVLMGGPVIFAQRRVGYRGRHFTCYKFRTMSRDAQELLGQHLAANPEAAREWHTTQKLTNDPRVGRLGRIFRKASLDELPQLFNVLRGDMSLVGPRPIVPEEVRKYGRHFHAYAIARPGITGMWQTNGRNSVSYSARVARDRHYARHWSLRLDLFLLLKTIPAVLKFNQTA